MIQIYEWECVWLRYDSKECRQVFLPHGTMNDVGNTVSCLSHRVPLTKQGGLITWINARVIYEVGGNWNCENFCWYHLIDSVT